MLQLPDKEKSFWREGFGGRTFSVLKEDVEVDTVIVGAGITGLSAAYFLKQAGQKVAVLEQRTVGSGTTGRTTGKVSAQHGAIYADMVKRHGRERAMSYAQANRTAVEAIDAIVKKHEIACNWQRTDSFVFTTNAVQVPHLLEEAKAALDLGLPAEFESATPLPFHVQGAVKFIGQGKIHSQKYLTGLARLVEGGGSHVFEGSRVMGFHDREPAYVLANGHKVIAKNIIVATKIPSFPLAARGGYALLEHPTESYGITCEIESELAGMYNSIDEHHQSILPHRVEGRNVLLLAGAGGNIPGVRISKDKRYRQLADYGEHYFPITRIINKWSDMDYLPYDHFPLVGRVYPSSKHLFMATGYMKWGLTNGTAAAMMLRDMILGEKNEWAPAFESMRPGPLLNIPRAFVEHFTSL